MSAVKDRGHWLILLFLALAQFMVVLDVSIVNVALPVMQRSLHITTTNLQWIVTAYTLCFGGFLLLGGRAADLYGRRRVFLTGVAFFAAASLADGLATSDTMLIILRGVQGLAAAFMSPAALSIVLVTYREGHERNVALSVWGAVAAGGAAFGVLLGGILTEYLGWRWIFFINVPVAIAVLIGVMRLVPKHESEETHNDLDLPGAVSVTAGLILLVYGLVKAPTYGWTDPAILGFLGGAVALLALFVYNESRAKNPLVPLSIFKIRNVTGADLTQLPIAAGLFSTFFFISLYVQNILHYSPVRTGLSFLVIPLVLGTAAANAPKLIKKVGYKKILMTAPLLVSAALFWFAHIPVHGSYWAHLLPPMVLLALGMGFTFVSVTVAATSGVPGNKAGLASGLLNTSQQIGGSLGLAVLSGIAASAFTRYLGAHATAGLDPAAAAVHGYHAAFYVAATFPIIAAILATLIIKEDRSAQANGAIATH